MEVSIDVGRLFHLATELQRKINRAIDALRDPDLDDADRCEAALNILEP